MITSVDTITQDAMNSIMDRPAIVKAQCQLVRQRFWILVLRIIGYTVFTIATSAFILHIIHDQRERHERLAQPYKTVQIEGR